VFRAAWPRTRSVEPRQLESEDFAITGTASALSAWFWVDGGDALPPDPRSGRQESSDLDGAPFSAGWALAMEEDVAA